jgi:hypothetical protein
MKYVYISLLSIAIAVILYLLFKPTPEYDTTQLKQYEKAYNRTVDSLRALRVADKEQWKQDSICNSKNETAYQNEIKRLKSQAAAQKQKHEVTKVLIDNPETSKYVVYLDSIIITQDARIDTLNTEKTKQWVSFNKIIESYEAENQANKELNKYFQNTLDDLNKANKKLKRQNTGLKVGIVVIPLAVVALVLAK